MKNSIVHMDRENADKVLPAIKNDPNTFCVEIDGRNCKVSSDYLTEVSIKFRFPMISKGYDGYLDWIRDLLWIKEEKIVLVIDNFEEFLCEDQDGRHTFVRTLEEYVFPWWESEVCEHMVEGKPRSFMVYLINE